MNLKRIALGAALAASTLGFTGCGPHYAPGPPPPPGPGNPLAAIANANGDRDGHFAGRRDADRRFPYAPRRSPAFVNTPGYDPHFGPYGPYRQIYRGAFLRAYDFAYRRHE